MQQSCIVLFTETNVLVWAQISQFIPVMLHVEAADQQNMLKSDSKSAFSMGSLPGFEVARIAAAKPINGCNDTGSGMLAPQMPQILTDAYKSIQDHSHTV